MRKPYTLCGLIVLVLSALPTSAAPSPVDLQVEHIGVPFPSWSSPVYSHATLKNQNPHLTRASHLAPRFHRLLRYGLDISSKSQTAIFVAGRSAEDEEKGKQGASIVSALNPRNGETGTFCVLFSPGQNVLLYEKKENKSLYADLDFVEPIQYGAWSVTTRIQCTVCTLLLMVRLLGKL